MQISLIAKSEGQKTNAKIRIIIDQQIKLLQQAHYYLLNQNINEATKAYSSYLNSNPQDFEALICRSQANYQLGRYEESVSDAEKAILIDRKRFEGFYRRGLANLSIGKNQTALIDLDEALSKAIGEPRKHIESLIFKHRGGDKDFKDLIPYESDESQQSNTLQRKRTSDSRRNQNFNPYDEDDTFENNNLSRYRLKENQNSKDFHTLDIAPVKYPKQERGSVGQTILMEKRKLIDEEIDRRLKKETQRRYLMVGPVEDIQNASFKQQQKNLVHTPHSTNKSRTNEINNRLSLERKMKQDKISFLEQRANFQREYK